MISTIFKRALLFGFCALACHQPLQAFLVVNQTDKDRVLSLQEAYRPVPTESPVPLNKKAKKITVPAHSSTIVEMTPCSVLLLNTFETPAKKKKKAVKLTSCYEPYHMDGSDAAEMTNDWGLVIHLSDTKPNPFLPDSANEYGVKLVHPDLLNQVDPYGGLPIELQSISECPLWEITQSIVPR